MAAVFIDDEVGYQQWLRKHQDGYVLNAQRAFHRTTWFCIGRPAQLSQISRGTSGVRLRNEVM